MTKVESGVMIQPAPGLPCAPLSTKQFSLRQHNLYKAARLGSEVQTSCCRIVLLPTDFLLSLNCFSLSKFSFKASNIHKLNSKRASDVYLMTSCILQIAYLCPKHLMVHKQKVFTLQSIQTKCYISTPTVQKISV